MEQEVIDIFTEEGEWKGVATRLEIHEKGEWHQTFHCHLISQESDGTYIIFQKRHHDKDTFPNKFDIAVGGHLSAGESPRDGVREIWEEVGLTVLFEELIPIGVFKESITTATFSDREFCHVFYYVCKVPIKQFVLQQEEVTGIIKMRIEEAQAMFKGESTSAFAKGYLYHLDGTKEWVELVLTKEDFTYLESTYYQKVLNQIQLEIRGK